MRELQIGNPVRFGAKTRTRGFTLVELMVTVAVLAIVAVVALPGFTMVFNSNRLSSQANALVASIQHARMEALRLGRPVSVCRSTDATTCAGSGEWSQWIVVAPASGGRAAQVIRSETANAAVEITSSVDELTFGSNGMARNAAGGLLSATLTVCIATTRPAANQRLVTLASGSRVAAVSAEGGGECP